MFYLSQQPPIELFLCDFKLKQLGNFAAVPCKSILHSSPRAYGNSRGIVTHPREAELAAALLFSGRNVKWEFKKPLKKLGWCCFYLDSPRRISHLSCTFNLEIGNVWKEQELIAQLRGPLQPQLGDVL